MSVRSIFFLCLVAFSCDPQMIDDPIPLVTFNPLVLNLGLPDNAALRVDGGMKSFNSIGVRGVIVYRVSANSFRAYERNCSYHPNEAGSTVDIDASNLFFKDFSCGSQFNLSDGNPTGGPAWRSLRQYQTDVTNGILTITSEVIN